MPSPSKAVLTQILVYLANNNVRKNIGSFVTNVNNANGAIQQEFTIVLANNGTFTYTGVTGNLITIVYCSQPLQAAVTFAGGGGYTKTITNILVHDTEVSGIVFTNQGVTLNSELTIISG